MPKPVLMAWELGAGRGHAVRLAAIGAALKARGLQPVFAVQRLEAMEVRPLDGATYLQAPLWPSAFASALPPPPGRPATLGDVLADFGLRKRSTVQLLVCAWDHIFSLLRPAAIVADFSPMCLLAAQGRVPSLATGTGYSLPPAEMPDFPIIRPDEQKRKYDESTVLEAVNGALTTLGRPRLDGLPAILAADRACIACFMEIDPYVEHRTTPYAAPFVDGWDRTYEPGEEIFVYLPEYLQFNPTIATAIENVARAGKAVRIYVPGLDPTIEKSVASVGVVVEREPVPLDLISRRSRLIISHGGCGTVSFALAAGIPQIVIAFDIEKLLAGKAIERLGAGRCMRLQRDNPLEGPLLAQAILDAADDQTMASRAQSVAPGFRSRLAEDPAERIADAVEDLLGT